MAKRAILYRRRDAHRLGGPEALRLRDRPSKVEASKLAAARLAADRQLSRRWPAWVPG